MRIIFLKKIAALILGATIGFVGISAFATSEAKFGNNATTLLHADLIATEDISVMSQLSDEISSSRVIYIGETHNQLDHHMNQLAVISELYNRGVDFAIGVEFFLSPYQEHLDEYIAGHISEKALLKKTGYYSNWGYDYRLYRPILEFARNHQINIIALNAPSRLVAEVSSRGFEGVTADMRYELPEIQIHPDDAYKKRLRKVFDMHPNYDKKFKHFLQVQLLWDEYMAATAANFLQEHPKQKLVVLAGTGHVAVSSGIPQRVQRIVPHEYTVLASASVNSGPIEFADHLLLADGDKLPVAGRLGLHLREEDHGIAVKSISRERFPALTFKLRPGDMVTSIAGERVRTIDDVRLAMLDRLPGEQVWMEIERSDSNNQKERLAAVIVLI